MGEALSALDETFEGQPPHVEREQPSTPTTLGDVQISVVRASDAYGVLAIRFTHPDRGAEVVSMPLELGHAVMLAHALLGAVCSAPPPEVEA